MIFILSVVVTANGRRTEITPRPANPISIQRLQKSASTDAATSHDAESPDVRSAQLSSLRRLTAQGVVRPIEPCPLHCEIVIEREQARGLEICASRGRARIERERGAPTPTKRKGPAANRPFRPSI